MVQTRIVGENIKGIRESVRNYKRSYVANRLNITTRAYANIENSACEITVNRLVEIANILGCRPVDILTYQKENNPYQTSSANINDLIRLTKLMEEIIECKNQYILLLEAVLKEHNLYCN